MAISESQRRLRANRLGSSDATRVMAGDWLRLWLEKTGRQAPDDLDFVAAVQIGVATEALHPRFWTRRTGIPCLPASDRSYVHPHHDWLICHPDFLTWSAFPHDPFLRPDTLLEAKFCGGPRTDEMLAEQYYWQLQHQMLVTGFSQAILSILRPGGYSWIAVPANGADQDHLLRTLAAFWWHVENDIEPGDPLPVAAPDFDRLRVVCMNRHNAFADHARTLLDNRAAWQAYRGAEADLKALMPDDARIAFLAGEDGGLHLTRSRDGRLALRFGQPPAAQKARAQDWQSDWPAQPPDDFTD